jgi:hypothetical protein
MMPENTVNERTLKLIETISEIVDQDPDKGIFRLQQTAPQELKRVLAGKSALEDGLRNDQAIKKSIAEILAERTVIDSQTGEEKVDLVGDASGKGFSSVTEFNADELRKNLDAYYERSARIQKELSKMQTLLEEKVASVDPSQVQVSIDIRKNINLRNAMRRVFDGEHKTITFEQYKQAVQLKKRFDREEVEAASDDEVKL